MQYINSICSCFYTIYQYRILVVIRAPLVCSTSPSSGHLSFSNLVQPFGKSHSVCRAPPIFLRSNIILSWVYHRKNKVNLSWGRLHYHAAQTIFSPISNPHIICTCFGQQFQHLGYNFWAKKIR